MAINPYHGKCALVVDNVVSHNKNVCHRVVKIENFDTIMRTKLYGADGEMTIRCDIGALVLVDEKNLKQAVTQHGGSFSLAKQDLHRAQQAP